MSNLLPVQQAYLDAYAAACSLLPGVLRPKLILFGGAASIAHGMTARDTKDVDILADLEVLEVLAKAIDNRQGGFHRECDGEVRWTKRYANNVEGFQVTVELVLLGGPFVPLVPDVVSFGEGYVATLLWLVRFRASTLVNRGDKQDYNDFRWLVATANQKGERLPYIDEEELETMVAAVEMCVDDDGLETTAEAVGICVSSPELEVCFMNILGPFELKEVVWSCWEDWALGL